MTTTTQRPGASSQGAVASVRMFCASCSSVPQETMGAWRPSPRKLSAVSARIMPGMARVAAAMMWLVKLGTMWRVTMRQSLAPSSCAAVTKSSVRSDRKRPRTTRASSVQPISERISVIAK